jgi:GWxTD domain-containing protein
MNDLEFAIGSTLIHALWQAGIAAIVLAALLSVVRSSSVRYALACAALLAIVAAFAATLVHFVPQHQDGKPGRFALRLLQDPGEFAAPAQTAKSRIDLQKALPWITPLWLIGVAIFNIRHLANWFATRRMRTRGICVAPAVWQDRLNRARTRLSVSKSVALLESCLVQVPVVIGQIHPVILLPVGLLAGLPAEQIELILMHELSHIRRYDYIVNMLQTFIEGVMFYNPAVWWISKVIRTERENCCDDLVVAATQNAHAYAAALAALEESRSVQSELAIAATGGSLVKRIRRLLRQPEMPGFALLPLVSAGLLIVITAVVLGARPAPASAPVQAPAAPAPITTTPIVSQPQVPPAPVRQTPDNVPPSPTSETHKRWVDEVVTYIITDEEREAWKGLQSGEEREQFIEQFWLRRNPTPGMSKNEFKEELYRRIAYANEKFGTGSTPGWKTDRGRISIMYGQPDEIESQPTGTYIRPGGGALTFPFEIWRYRYIEGIGNDVLLEFVDTTSTGDYRLSIDPKEKNQLLQVPK